MSGDLTALSDNPGLAVRNHGVPKELIKEHFDVQRRFFSLPLEQKMTILADANNRSAMCVEPLYRFLLE